MKKIIAILLVLVLALGMFAGCGAPEDDKIVIAGIYKAGDQEWFIGEGEAAKKQALSMGADDFQYIDAKMSGEEYLRALDNAIASNVAGILVCIPDQNLSAVTVEKCKDAGIPVIAADDPLVDADGNLIAPLVGMDAYVIGEAVGQWAVDYYKANEYDKSNTALLYMTMDTVSSCVPRTDGAEDVWVAAMSDEIPTFRADYDGQTDKAFTAAANIFAANPNIENWIVVTPNDEGALGTTRALEEAGLDAKSAVCGIGGYEAKKEFKKDESCFKASAFVDFADVGRMSAESLMNFILNGTEIPANQAIPARMVTKENYIDVMGE